ncbi:MAG: transcription-repair coupling factor, partial [Oscillospiraceae bacterium]|nr:transcription-repair coupling factor [Oscillospiraceae bacterium]
MSNKFWLSEWAPLLRAMDAGKCPVLISGIGASSRAHAAATLRREMGFPLFIICPDDQSAEIMARDMENLLGEIPLLLPSREINLYPADSVSRGEEQKRLAALFTLSESTPPITVCSAFALCQRTMPMDTLRAASATIQDGADISMEEVEAKLIRCGYVHRVQVEAPGQYSRRGGILDFYSPAYSNPVRIEFWGDSIDSMGLFDLQSQRRIENIDSCRILPSAETLPSLYDGGISALADKLNQAALSAQRSKRAENQLLAQTLRRDAERLRELGSLAAADRYAGIIYPEYSSALDYIPEDCLVFISESARCGKLMEDRLKLLSADLEALLQSGSLMGKNADFCRSWDEAIENLAIFPIVMGEYFTTGRIKPEPAAIVGVTAKQLPSYGGSLETACDDVKHYLSRNFALIVLASDTRRAGSLRTFFADRNITARIIPDLNAPINEGECVIAVGALSGGFEYPNSRLAVLTDTQIMQPGLRKGRKRKAADSKKRKLDSYADLSVGDLVVHEYHGIGRFNGIVKMKVDGIEKDYVKIAYAGTDSLYVPATQLDLVSKYIGGGEDKVVKLSKMGGAEWTRVKTRAKAAAKEMAAELIRLYAERLRLPGHAFAPDSPWQEEFEDAFGYQETDDQLRCIADIKRDMESSTPMDRLLCGDVGYGKTEVALRAVMKCVLDGKQAAILVPTTVLAQQHYQTAMQRFFGYPVKIEVLSRFRTAKQLKATKTGIADGSVDIVIGTHALLQKDVAFKDLGLLVIDEEQRFGVTHKERLKEMSRNVDVLTLSATPIPRTLNMAMSGIRDMSTLEEPPQDRLPVQTYVMEHDWGVVADAIRREIARGGQVFYLHNRVESIERTASRIMKMLPDVSVDIAHGKMDQESITLAMEGMVSGDTQVLVCTTIIETGIDIPNVNTLIIEDADKMGLAQLHQIRGRVGRSNRRASAYLTYRKDKVLTEIAEKRLSAIREFAEFNSGFRIAMRDLEIRGAGNLLGAEQSGHMTDVGYDMYLKLLEEAVLEERGIKTEKRAECAADLAVSANIPERYVSSAEIRMDLYRRIALIRTE